MRTASPRRFVSNLTRNTMAVIMAGGRGSRLEQLTDHRAKPGTPFGGKYRIIDFSLSNSVNSGIRQILVLTQYKAQSLIQHIQRGWGYLHGELGEFIDIVPAQQKIGELWYRGTADAVYQNLDIIDQHQPDTVLVLAGDHVYKMDYGPMIALHRETGADITVGGVQVPLEQADQFGVMTLDRKNRVIRFDEKPSDPSPMPGAQGGWRWRPWESTCSARTFCASSCSPTQRTMPPLTISGATSFPGPCIRIASSPTPSNTSRPRRNATGGMPAPWTPTTRRISNWCT